jgi:uncharacterized protein
VNFFQQHDVLWLLALAASLGLTGLVAGVLAGLLGVGGGIVIVPVLFHLFSLLGIDESVRMHLAVGTSLASIIPTSILSARAHRQRGSLSWPLLQQLLPWVVLGVLLGAVLSGFISGKSLSAVFATVALLVAINMAFKPQGFSWGDTLPGGPARALIGASIGSLSTLMGIGGGTLSVPLLSAFKTPMHTAVGTGAALGLVISLPGALALMFNGWDADQLPPGSVGYVNLLGLALIVPATLISTSWGARLAHATDARRLRQLFALFLALTSARMFQSLWA